MYFKHYKYEVVVAGKMCNAAVNFSRLFADV